MWQGPIMSMTSQNYLFLRYVLGCVDTPVLDTQALADLRAGARAGSRCMVVMNTPLLNTIGADFPADNREADDNRDPAHSSHHGDSVHRDWQRLREHAGGLTRSSWIITHTANTAFWASHSSPVTCVSKRNRKLEVSAPQAEMTKRCATLNWGASALGEVTS